MVKKLKTKPSLVVEEEEQELQSNAETDEEIEEHSSDANMEVEEDISDAGEGSAEVSRSVTVKKRKKGIIYVSNIPKHMNVTRIREILGAYGVIGRVYLQPEKVPLSNKANSKKKKKRLARHFTEGWVEFESKRIAKQVAEFLNNKQIGTRKKSQFYDCFWVMKYLPRFKWIHLSEKLNYETAVHKQRLMTEVSQARKEATFFQDNLDKSEFLKKKNKKAKDKVQS